MHELSVVPADQDLEGDVLTAAALWGDYRWILDDLERANFHVYRELFEGLRDAHRAEALVESYDEAGIRRWDGLKPWAESQLNRVIARSAPMWNLTDAIGRLRLLTVERQRLDEALDLIARYEKTEAAS